MAVTPEATTAPSEATPEATATRAPTAAPSEAPSEAAGDVSDGQALFDARCAGCHGPEGEGTSIATEALNDAAWLADHTDEDLMEAILEGVDGKMPAFSQLDEQEVLDLIALLRSWQ